MAAEASKADRVFDIQSRIGIAAAGRLGSSLALALNEAGYHVAALSSRRPEHRSWLREKVPDAEVVTTLVEVAEHADVVFLTTPDGVIEELCSSIYWTDRQAAVHCAGVLPVAALESAERTGAAIGALHPLQTFPGPDCSDRFEGITFAVEAPDNALKQWLTEVAENLGGHPLNITSQQRAAYHASAVMACGLLAAWTGLAAEMWQKLGVSREEALESLLPLIDTTIDSLAEHGLPTALTGPYVRGDAYTVKKHILATAERSPAVGVAYAALALAGLPMAAEQGTLSEEAREEIESALREALARHFG